MVTQHYRWDFIGLSTDTKPTPETSEKVTDGSTYYCSDTSKLYIWCKDNWYEKVVEGGGGASYTAGDGIDITGTTISTTNTGKSKVLTSDDFNWNYETGTTESPNAVALWLLPSGLYGYNGDFNLPVYLTPYQNWTGTGALFLVSPLKEDINCVTITAFLINGSDVPQYTVSLNDGSIYGQNIFPSNNGVISIISSYILTGYGAPSNTDYGTLGKMYVDTSTGTIYYCSNIDTSDPEQYLYTWSVLSGGGSAYTELTIADYNWPTNNPDSIALWLLPTGVYTTDGTLQLRQASGFSMGSNFSMIVVGEPNASNYKPVILVRANVTGLKEHPIEYLYVQTTGTGFSQRSLLDTGQVVNDLITSTSGYVLDARQGKALKDLIDNQTGMGVLSTTPTGTTAGFAGRLYTLDTGGGVYEVYLCVHDNGDNTYVWKQVSLI